MEAEVAKLVCRKWWSLRSLPESADDLCTTDEKGEMIPTMCIQKRSYLTIESWINRPSPITFCDQMFNLISNVNFVYSLAKPSYRRNHKMSCFRDDLYYYNCDIDNQSPGGLVNYSYCFNDEFEFGVHKIDKVFDIYALNSANGSLIDGKYTPRYNAQNEFKWLRQKISNTFILVSHMLCDYRNDWFDANPELDVYVKAIGELVSRVEARSGRDDIIFDNLNVVAVDGFIMEGKTEFIEKMAGANRTFSSEPDAFYRTYFRGTFDGKKERIPYLMYKCFAAYGYIASILAEQLGEKRDLNVIYWDRSFLSHDTFEINTSDFRSFFTNIPSLYCVSMHMEIICLSHTRIRDVSTKRWSERKKNQLFCYDIPYPFFDRRSMEAELYASKEDLRTACVKFYDEYLNLARKFYERIITPFNQQATYANKLSISVNGDRYVVNQCWGDFPRNYTHAIWRKIDPSGDEVID